MRNLCIVLVLLALICPTAFAYEGRRADSVLLNGDWQYVVGDGNEAADTAAGQDKLTWLAAKLPGQFVPFVQGPNRPIPPKLIWSKRTFEVSAQQAGKLAVLRWNQINFGAVAYINGQKVGENAPTGPYQVVLPKGVLKAGENTIVLKVLGAASVAKGGSGFILIPAGFASSSANPTGVPAVLDDVWIDFADTAYIKWALSLPDLAASKVAIRVTPTGPEAVDDMKVAVQVKFSDGNEIGRGAATTKYKPDPDPLGGEHTTVEVPMPSFKPWTHEECNLYTATVQLLHGGKVLDEVSFRFGMREIKVAERRFKLNGRNLFLRGSDFVGEWMWPHLDLKGKEKDYLVTEAHEMSMNSFRTHTMPPPRLWADICDENGTMILAEFPNLYNYSDANFTPEEFQVFRKNALTDAAGWMGRLWNHPSVIMWVLSNESSLRTNRAWETGPYQDTVLKLDPTRPTMRAGEIGATKFNRDFHTCNNITDPVELTLMPQFALWQKQCLEYPGATCTNTEYMNYFKRAQTQWTGTEDKDADAMACSQLGMEHTEAMRRLRYDGLWPFMYAGWTKTRTSHEWKAGYAAPFSAALHSALSPVLASLDLSNANYLPAQEVTTDLYLINDSWHDANLHVDLLLTKECPEFIPEANCFETPMTKWSFDFQVKADTMTKTPIKWKLPDQLGNYWLTARTTAVTAAPPTTWPTRPVLSQRFVRTVTKPEVPKAALDRTFVLLAADDAIKAWFKAKGLRTSDDVTGIDPAKHIVIFCGGVLPEAQLLTAKSLCDFAAAGGRVVVMGADNKWFCMDLCDASVTDRTGSRVFPYAGITHPLMAGIDPQWLVRWNGVTGQVATAGLRGRTLDDAQKVLWVQDPQMPVAAEVPATTGIGKILFVLLDIPNHLDKTKSTYDPAAENILMNILALPAPATSQGGK